MNPTYSEIFEIARRQSAVDAGCAPDDFLRAENVIVSSEPHPGARKYLSLPFDCNLISYGSNIVASVSPSCRDIVSAYIRRFAPEHCFETPHLLLLDDALRVCGLRVCFMAEYFLPDPALLTAPDCPYSLKTLEQPDFAPLYTGEWPNALCKARRELDVLGVGAFDGGRLIGLAACSADCESMWQIGIDVRPEYRRQGIASALTGRLARQILDRGKVPFYCAAWANIKSVRNALKCGFRPAWAELTARRSAFVDQMNASAPSI